MTGNEYQDLAMRTYDGLASDRLTRTIDEHDSGVSIGNWEFFGGAYDGIEHTYDVGGVLNACLGLSGETGELNDMVKKMIFHQKDTDTEHMKKELGDVLWYVALFCESMGWKLDDIMQLNIEKLEKRYPEGFDIDRANNRQEGDV